MIVDRDCDIDIDNPAYKLAELSILFLKDSRDKKKCKDLLREFNNSRISNPQQVYDQAIDSIRYRWANEYPFRGDIWALAVFSKMNELFKRRFPDFSTTTNLELVCKTKQKD